MKPIPDPLDELIAAAIYGELSPTERTQFESRLQTDAAARAAYQEAQRMHDLLEKTYREAQPDDAFEQRMISGVRRKLEHEEKHRETAWESLVVLWKMLMKPFTTRRSLWEYGLASGIAVLLVSFILTGFLGSFSTRRLGPEFLATLRENALAPQKQALNNQEYAKVQKDNRDGAPVASSAGLAGDQLQMANNKAPLAMSSPAPVSSFSVPIPTFDSRNELKKTTEGKETDSLDKPPMDMHARTELAEATPQAQATTPGSSPPALTDTTSASVDSRKLIRDAELELEVKSFSTAVDQIAAFTKTAGGYVDTSNSQRGGNGKLQGTIVVKVLPQNLDAFLLQLRELGNLKNQSIRTEDVTKAYFDTQARLDNSRRMEIQLQDLLTHANGRVSDLLQVERELGRVRGEIEQMQGQLKLYDFQVEYATVTMQVSEKDLNQTAAYLLKEQDDFSLYAHDVEGTFQQARHAAEEFKAQILTANLNHNSGSNVSAELLVAVPPDQIEPFLDRVKALGRMDNFTRQTQRVAQDGGESDQPADQTLTEKDKVQVHLAVRSDDESAWQQTQVSIRSKEIDGKAQQIKKDATDSGIEVKASSFVRQPDGSEFAQLTFRLPLSKYSDFLDHLKTFGTVESLTVSRQDRPDQTHADDSAPVDIYLQLHNQPDLVPDDRGFWATLRATFGDGAAALLTSIRTIGVVTAFLAPWLLLIGLLAWGGRRIYVGRRK